MGVSPTAEPPAKGQSQTARENKAMTTTMVAPADCGGAQCDGVDYEVADGHIVVENPEHVAKLEAHGFVVVPGEVSSDAPAPEPPPAPAPEPVAAKLDDPGDCPDFSKFANRAEIVAWMVAHGADGVSPDTARPDLEVAAINLHGELAAAYAAQVEAKVEA